MDTRVQLAIDKCKKTVEDALMQHVEARARAEAAMTLWEKFVRFVRRETAFLWKMGRIGG
jgi:hypothetical protein